MNFSSLADGLVGAMPRFLHRPVDVFSIGDVSSISGTTGRTIWEFYEKDNVDFDCNRIRVAYDAGTFWRSPAFVSLLILPDY
jgi:hypothetical protein